MEEKSKDKTWGSILKLDFANLLLKSSTVFYAVEGFKYTIKIGDCTKTTVVNILKSADPGKHSQNWLLRFDNPHKGTMFAHLNIRHKYTGIKDPHLKLPPGSLMLAKSGGYMCKFINYVQNVTFFYDTFRLGTAVKKDYDNKTVENTVGCVTDITLTWAGGFLGASVGAVIGPVVLPGVGALIGTMACGTAGVFYGSALATSLTAWQMQTLNKLNLLSRFYKSEI